MSLTVTQAQPLVLLNGITRRADTWAPLEDLFPGRSAVAFDGAASGGTSAAVSSIPEQARHVLARMDAAGVASADVVGFSHGGLVAQQLAAVAPQRVRSLVLLSTSCGAGAIAPVLWRRGPWSRARDADSSDVSAIVGQVIAISAWSSIPFLGGITAATLVVHGAHDRLVPVENARVLARRIPGAELVILDTGHDLQRPDRVAIVADVIQQFWDKTTA